MKGFLSSFLLFGCSDSISSPFNCDDGCIYLTGLFKGILEDV